MNAPYFRLAYASLLYPSPSKRSFCEKSFGLWELNPPPVLGRTYFPAQAHNTACPPALVAGVDLPSPACCSLQDCHQVGE